VLERTSPQINAQRDTKKSHARKGLAEKSFVPAAQRAAGVRAVVGRRCHPEGFSLGYCDSDEQRRRKFDGYPPVHVQYDVVLVRVLDDRTFADARMAAVIRTG